MPTIKCGAGGNVMVLEFLNNRKKNLNKEEYLKTLLDSLILIGVNPGIISQPEIITCEG